MKKTILIVEDEEDIRKGIAIELECEGKYRCVEVPDRQDALAVLQDGLTPDLILVDIMMPSSPEAGLDLIKDLKAQTPWKRLPVVVLSARSQSGIILKALQYGAIDYLIKPYDPAELLNRVWRACELNETLPSDNPDQVSAKPLGGEQEQRWRTLHVEVMQLSLLYWETSLQKTKVDLAEMSGIWSIYLDTKGTFRTKTLDRYLNKQTLPKRPHTHRVVHTAEYVLKHCPPDEILCAKLQTHLDELNKLNRNQSL